MMEEVRNFFETLWSRNCERKSKHDKWFVRTVYLLRYFVFWGFNDGRI